jgi:hypothetical protein
MKNTNIDILTVEQLFNLINSNKDKIIEASLLLNYKAMATHFLSIKKSFVFDEGIDGELTKWLKDEFVSYYNNTQWIINKIV